MNGSKNDNVNSPSIDKPPLMTRRELNDPFGSDEEDEKDLKSRKKSPELISPPSLNVDDVRQIFNEQ